MSIILFEHEPLGGEKVSRLWARALYFEPHNSRAACVKVPQLVSNLIGPSLQRPDYLSS